MTGTALSTAATGMAAQQFKLDVDVHNIANMSTPAFQRRFPLLTTMAYQDVKRVGSLSSSAGTILPTGVQIGLGVKAAGVGRSLEYGTAVQTGDDYHMAIQGKGYFQIQMPDGRVAYTRAGVFSRNAEGKIVTLEGYTVLPEITVPQNTAVLTINPEGEVLAKIDGQQDPQTLGQIELADFANPGGLDAIEDNLFLETAASGSAITARPGADSMGRVLQHWYEGSNTNAVEAVTNLISTQRAFEMNTKSMRTAEQMLEELKNI